MAVPAVYHQFPLFPQNEKQCTTCGAMKPPDEFYRDRKAKDGRCSACIPCRCLAAKAQYAANPEPAKARRRAYYQANTAHVKARELAYARRNRERVRERAHERLAAHRETIRERQRAYRRAHLEQSRAWERASHARHAARMAAYGRSWRAKRPDYHRLKRQHYRARKLAAGGTCTQADIKEMERAQGGLCAYCHQPYGRYHIEHKVPLSRGGTNDPHNLCLSCQRCNSRKWTRTDDEFRAWLERQQ